MKHPSTKARSNMQKQGMERHADDAQTGRCNKHDSQTTCLTLITEQSKNKSSPIHLTPADSKHTGDFIEHHKKKKKSKRTCGSTRKKKGVGGGEGEVRVCACAKGPCRHPIAPKEQKKERRKELQKGQGHKCKDKATRGQEDEAGGGDKQRVMLLEANKSVAKLVCTLAMPAHRLLGVRVKVPAVPGARHL